MTHDNAQLGQNKGLPLLLLSLKRDYGVQNRGREEITMLVSVDLTIQDNNSGIYFQIYGSKESFVFSNLGGKPQLYQPRLFHFGNRFPIQVKQHMVIVNNLTGNCVEGYISDIDPLILHMYKIQRKKQMYRVLFL